MRSVLFARGTTGGIARSDVATRADAAMMPSERDEDRSSPRACPHPARIDGAAPGPVERHRREPPRGTGAGDGRFGGAERRRDRSPRPPRPLASVRSNVRASASARSNARVRRSRRSLRAAGAAILSPAAGVTGSERRCGRAWRSRRRPSP